MRPVNTGGFSSLIERRGGEERAAQWWDAAFSRMELLDGPQFDHGDDDNEFELS